jgi:GNAT superfamily N-acetyltransferase
MMDRSNYRIIEPTIEWADKYRLFCQEAYLAAYVRPEHGITAELYSQEVFDSHRVKNYFRDLFRVSDDHKIWLAINQSNNLLGGVGATLYADYCDMKAFYVAPKLKGRGIGHRLYEQVLAFAGSMPIQVDVVEYMTDTVNMYRHWGFEIAKSKGVVAYRWDEWPKDVRHTQHGIYRIIYT